MKDAPVVYSRSFALTFKVPLELTGYMAAFNRAFPSLLTTQTLLVFMKSDVAAQMEASEYVCHLYGA